MPFYSYVCGTCANKFEEFRKMRDNELPAECPECHKEARLWIEPVYFTVEGGESARRKRESDDIIFEKARRARALKDAGVIPSDEPVHPNDKRLDL